MFLKTAEEVKNYIDNLSLIENDTLMILVGEKSSNDLEGIREYLNNKDIRFFGGIYPRLLVEDKCLRDGFIIQIYQPVYLSIVLPCLMRFKMDKSLIKDNTALVLSDGLSSKVQDLMDTIYDKVGNEVTYIGGGAGFYDLSQRPCIFDNKGVYQDVAYVCIIKNKTKIAVKHGWNKLDGPYNVTESHGNIISKIDGYSAFHIYRDVMEEVERITLYKSDFFIYAKDHPFGIVQKGKYDLIVRDPISITDSEEIICVANIPEGSDVYILKGDKNSLLSSSLEIAEQISLNAPEKYQPMLFNCISRAMFLEGDFQEELKNIQRKLNYKVIGALSIGEISSTKTGEVIIHNKSTVLGLVY